MRRPTVNRGTLSMPRAGHWTMDILWYDRKRTACFYITDSLQFIAYTAWYPSPPSSHPPPPHPYTPLVFSAAYSVRGTKNVLTDDDDRKGLNIFIPEYIYIHICIKIVYGENTHSSPQKVHRPTWMWDDKYFTGFLAFRTWAEEWNSCLSRCLIQVK